MEEEREKKNKPSDTKAITHHLPSSRLKPSQLRSKRWPAYLNPPSLPFYCWAWRRIAWNNSLVSLGHLPSCIPSQPVLHTQSIHWRISMRNGEGFVTCGHRSATVKRCLLSTLVRNPKYGTRQAAMRKINCVPAKTQYTCKGCFNTGWVLPSVLCIILRSSIRHPLRNSLPRNPSWSCGRWYQVPYRKDVWTFENKDLKSLFLLSVITMGFIHWWWCFWKNLVPFQIP